MIKILRYTEYLYLAVALISLYKIGELWEADRDQAYVFVFFAVVSIAMFFFRRNYRKRFEKRRESEKS
ncbi:hypothetical protein [Robiginitalea marina]|uniref:Uncharacterized protein n=1 Tax=Robiginitalea marina TaxID=2954105 RepID=A0ABT1B2P1_9FLAO|nr:hypothetical protein [Robiginitalea marina]MCO5725698.1 hypothetical protein [Robiginitalea marina]